ncbi:phospholipase D family protein [Ralstonia nicotianae]
MRSAVAAEPTNAPDSQAVEIAFSPDGRAEALVLKVIRSAKSSIRLAGYTFTSPAIVRALADAKRRGVDVAVVVDYKNNLVENRSNTSRQALNLLVNAGIPTRTVSVYPIHHDKYIVVDGLHVETGSFNFTTAAARRNSENVVVLWNNPDAARQYIAHWQSRWEQGQQYQSSY